ncbi:glutathione S-transferase family protein [Acinetobacter sp. B5B]|uniref:glutathione S-transferase family protein n=1 Tax=Acinetobacter baretiae TaxID=2605383 RepID=UPI0018C2D327|nr:glutathione S-transferase family protein [Acinetobacter baretiae]MBF7683035.1 glutathione S-transferase family protein [Acinetobacter baretiae]
MLIHGKWADNWHPVQATDEKGGFVRQTSSFRHWITPDGSAGITGHAGFKAEADRYHLYVALICPWASRTLMARKLKGLESIISLSIVEPWLLEQGWHFGHYLDSTIDHLHGVEWAHQLYTKADPDFTGRATVPILWDKKNQTIVNNESADILRMFNSAFGSLAQSTLDLYPKKHQEYIDELNIKMYDTLNNGVYRAGFATTQESYTEAVCAVFKTLHDLEHLLSDQRDFLCGQDMTEADIRLFVTLIRFDVAYHGLFKCNLYQLKDFTLLNQYIKRMLNYPGVKDTVNINHIKQGYYSIRALNPTGLVPIGPM